MKIKVISPNAQRAQQVAQIVQGSSPGLDVVTAVSPMAGLPEVVNGSRPALLVLDAVDDGGLDSIAELTHAQPEVESIVISSERSPAFLLKAMQVGVREVLPLHIDEEALRAAVQRVARKRQPVDAPEELGQVIVTLGCKGGSGCTFIAANLAHGLSRRDGRTVGLLDFDLQFGDALLMLSDARPRSDLAEVGQNIARLDAQLLRSAMVAVSGTLSVLAAPQELSRALEVNAQHAEAVIQQARRMFDFVVIDVGRSINGVSLKAIDMASHLLPVLQLTLPGMRDAKRLRDLFASLDVPAGKVTWLVNRFQKTGDIPVQALRQTLGVETVSTVPNHFTAVSAAVNQGRPLEQLSRNHPVTRSLLEVAEKLSPAQKQRRDGWLTTIFGN